MNQIDMFLQPGPIATAMRDRSLPYKRGSATSKAAAELTRPKAVPYRTAIEGYFKGRGALGATRDEICQNLGIQIQTICPRITELSDDGLIVNSGTTRKTRAGRSAEVWVAKEYAQ